jgi:hypothetical protein
MALPAAVAAVAALARSVGEEEPLREHREQASPTCPLLRGGEDAVESSCHLSLERRMRPPDARLGWREPGESRHGEGGGGRAAGGEGAGEPLSWGIGAGGEQAGVAVGCGKEAGDWEKNARGLGLELPDFAAISREQRGFLQNWQAGVRERVLLDT